VNQLMAHLNARYQGHLPFEVAVQTFNEPNWMLSVGTGIPHTATTPDEAAAALITFEIAARLAMNRYPSMVSSGLTLYTSPLSRASGPVGTRYLMLAEAAQSGAHVFDGFTFHSYSDQGSSPLTAAALIHSYSDDLRTISQVVDRYPHLRVLPRHQTETNHAITMAGGATHVYSIADQQVLLSRLLVDGLRWGLRSQSLYTVNPKLFPLDVRLGADGRAQGNPALLSTLKVTRSWLVGRDLVGCRVSRGVVRCTLRNPTTHRISRVMWSEDCTRRLVTAPAGTVGVQQVSGARRAVTAGSTIVLGAAPQRVY